VLVAR
jgi:hypothetical protein